MNRKPRLLLVLITATVFLLLIGKPNYLKSSKDLIQKPGIGSTFKYSKIGEEIQFQLPNSVTSEQVDIGIIGENSLLDYVAAHESWTSVAAAQARLNNSKDAAFSIFLSSKPQAKVGRASYSKPFRVFVLEHSSALLYEIAPQSKKWAKNKKNLLTSFSLRAALLIGQLKKEEINDLKFGQPLSKLIPDASLALPISISESSDYSLLTIRIEQNLREPLQIPVFKKSSELKRLSLRSKRAKIKSPQLAPAILSSQVLEINRIVAEGDIISGITASSSLGVNDSSEFSSGSSSSSEQIVDLFASTLSPAITSYSTGSASTSSSIPQMSAEISMNSNSSSQCNSSFEESQSCSQSSSSNKISSSSSSYASTSKPASQDCKCPYSFILIGGQGGDANHKIFKDLSKVLKGAVTIPLNPGGGRPDDVAGATEKAKQQVKENMAKGRKTLVVGFSLGGAIAIKEFSNMPCVMVYSIDPPVHMNSIYCNDFYGLFSKTCKILENAEKCLEDEPENVNCYWCTAGKCFPIKEHDPFTYNNQPRIDEIIAQIEKLKKSCED